MSTETATQTPVGELVYEGTLQVTGITEYGVSWADLTGGKIAPPPEGAYFDIAIEGTLTGDRLSGTIKAIDYAQVRADGRFTLHIHGTITTPDGERIAMIEDGVAIPPTDGSDRADVRLTASFGAGSGDYAWLNRCELRVNGQVTMSTGVINIQAWLA